MTRLSAAWFAGLLVLASPAPAEVKVTISQMHLCCRGCTDAVEKAAAKVPGVACTADEETSTAVVTGGDEAAVGKALVEIGKAGLSGKTDHKKLKFAPPKTPSGKIRRLEIAHIHNCCDPCNDAIEAAIAEVEGVAAETSEPKKSTFVVEGEFSPRVLVEKLMAAGFYPQLKLAEAKSQ